MKMLPQMIVFFKFCNNILYKLSRLVKFCWCTVSREQKNVLNFDWLKLWRCKNDDYKIKNF